MKNYTKFLSKVIILILNVTIISSHFCFAQTGLEFSPVQYSDIQWGDYNNDTYPDVLLIGESDNEGLVSKIYKNNGDGTFTEQTQIELTGVRLGSAAWGDYDNDGNLDILLTGGTSTTNWYANAITKIYKNNGDETFTEQTQIVLQAVTLSSVAWADFNNDTHLDILLTGNIASYNEVSIIYKNNGDGTFTDINAGLTGIGVSSVAWADINDDNLPDILITGRSITTHISKIYKNNGDETFTDINAGIMGIAHGEVACGDFNNDNYIDFVITGYDVDENPCSKIYINNQDETFTDLEAGLTGVVESSVAWGDYDNDSFIDILLTGRDQSFNYYSIIYKNNGNETFTEQTQIELTGVMNSGVAWADYNKDNYLDFIITGKGTNSRVAKLYTNNQAENFEPPKLDFGQFSSFDDIIGLKNSTVEWGDYNNDNYPDILLTGALADHNGRTKIYKNNQNGTFTDIEAEIMEGWIGATAAWGDYNNDNYLDVLIAGHIKGVNHYDTKIYKNNGDETFTEQTQIVLEGFAEASVAWGDYNQDNQLDFIITGYAGVPGVLTQIYKNNGDGTFTENTSAVMQGTYRGTITWNDFNNDTYPDILLTGMDWSSNHYVILYKNNGDETFTEMNAGIPQLKSCSVAWGDYNNDGYSDFILTGEINHPDYSSIIYKNNGDETFTEQTEIEITGINYGSVAWFDFNNDNNLDILLTGRKWNPYNVETKIYKNNGDETFTEQTNIDIEGVEIGDIDCADYNNDGFQDIIISGTTYTYEHISSIYANTGTSNFEKVNFAFPVMKDGHVSSVDYDKNGSADIFITGENISSVQIAEIYQNTKFHMENADISIPALTEETSSWGDFNNDGFLDLMICGKNNSGTPVTKLLRNSSSNKFIDTHIPFAQVYNADIDWADYNNDGRLDIVICGYAENNSITKIYKNTGDNFVETSAVFPPANFVEWGDFNNDNLYDLLISDDNSDIKVYQNMGNDNFELVYNYSNQYFTIKDLCFTDYNYDGFIDILVFKKQYSSYSLLYHKNNKDGTFSYPLIFDEEYFNFFESNEKNYLNVQDFNADGKPDLLFNYATYNNDPHIAIYSNNTLELEIPTLIPATNTGGLAWSDFDNDNDLDFFIIAEFPNGKYRSLFYNNGTEHNTKPEIPTYLDFNCTADTVFISWSPTTDNETNTLTLTYNCYMYEIDGDTIWHSMSNQATGKRYIEKAGNTGHNTSWYITGLDVEKEYAWSVQAVDNGFLGGEFADEVTFRLAPIFTLQPLNQTVCETGSITLNTVTTPANSYQWYRFTASDTLLIQNNEYFSNTSTPNLTISNATLDMHAYELHCKATTVGGDTYSQAAVLSVDSLFFANAGNDTTACDVTEIQLSANLPNNTTGLWSCENSNITFDNPEIPNTTVRNLPEDVASTLKWTITQQNVCGENSDLIIVTQNPSYSVYPVPPTPTGETEPCISQIANYQTAGIGYATSYLWEITPQEAGTAANDSIQTTITWSASYTGIANIRTKAQNACNYGEWSENLSVYIKSNPTQANIPTGDSGGCINGQNNFSTVQVSDANSYTWQISPATAGKINGNSSQITAQWQNNYSGEAHIKVKGVNQCGEGEFSDSLKIIITKPASSDIIEKSKTMLISVDSGYTYQWYINGEQINGATKQYYYNPNMPVGDYQVEIIDYKDCNNLSNIYTFGISTKTQKLSETISIYPNPTTGKFAIEIINDYTGKINFAITNAVGQIIFEEKINKETNYLKIEKDLLYLPTGIYLIEFVFEKEKVTKQLIVE